MKPLKAIFGLGMFIVIPQLTVAADTAKLALLVGCTKYPNKPGIRELSGPRNDVSKWAAMLIDPQGFAFPKQDVIQLVGWDSDETTRPTLANISKGFQTLIAKSGPGSRVVIVLSGHGVQIPIPAGQDPLDPKNPEPDGMDEVFLPADVGEISDETIENSLADNQIGAWLDKLRAKGAHVMIVFDSCHSGTMTRGGDDVWEVSRSADPVRVWNIPSETITRSVERANKAVSKAREEGRSIPGEEWVRETVQSTQGSLVAFFAAQPFEEAPELPLPEGAAKIPANTYGLLSFNLIEAITSRKSPISYRELTKQLSARYRSMRGGRSPTPFAEGDLNREVLGLATWPNRPLMQIEWDKQGRLTLNAGTFHGLTKGSIVAIQSKTATNRDVKSVLGYVSIDSIGPSQSVVSPAKLDSETSAISAKHIPNGARCELVRRNLGNMGTKLFVAEGAVKPLLSGLAAEVKEMVQLLPSEPEADWVLRIVTPQLSARDYGIADLKSNTVFLVSSKGRDASLDDPKLSNHKSGVPYPRVFGQYPTNDERELLTGLERDLPKIFKWENLWRVANAVAVMDDHQTHGLEVEVARLKNEGDQQGEVLRSGLLKDQDRVVFRARNGGGEDLWVTTFYLDANLGVQILYSNSVGRGKPVTLAKAMMTVENNSVGQEGIIVFAIPLAVQKGQPDFAILEQQPLQVAEVTTRGAKDVSNTPFGNLLRQASLNTGTRSINRMVTTTPAILIQSWRLVP